MYFHVGRLSPLCVIHLFYTGCRFLSILSLWCFRSRWCLFSIATSEIPPWSMAVRPRMPPAYVLVGYHWLRLGDVVVMASLMGDGRYVWNDPVDGGVRSQPASQMQHLRVEVTQGIRQDAGTSTSAGSTTTDSSESSTESNV